MSATRRHWEDASADHGIVVAHDDAGRARTSMLAARRSCAEVSARVQALQSRWVQQRERIVARLDQRDTPYFGAADGLGVGSDRPGKTRLHVRSW